MMNKMVVWLKVKVVCMFIIIVIGYVLFLGFVVVLVMLRLYGIFNNILFGVMLLVSWLVEFVFYISFLGNFLIYVYYNVDFWKEIIWLICKRMNKKEVLNEVFMVNIL